MHFYKHKQNFNTNRNVYRHTTKRDERAHETGGNEQNKKKVCVNIEASTLEKCTLYTPIDQTNERNKKITKRKQYYQALLVYWI